MTGSLDRSNVQGEVVSLSLEHLLRSNVTAADDPSNAATRHLLLEEAIKAAETASFAESKSIHTSYYAGHAYVARLWDSGRRFSPRRFQSMVDKASSALMRVITVSKLSLPDDIDEKIEKNEVLADERELLRMRQQSYATLVRLHITGFFYFASKNRSKKAKEMLTSSIMISTRYFEEHGKFPFSGPWGEISGVLYNLQGADPLRSRAYNKVVHRLLDKATPIINEATSQFILQATDTYRQRFGERLQVSFTYQ